MTTIYKKGVKMKKYNTCVNCGERVLADTDNGHEPTVGFFGGSEFWCEFCRAEREFCAVDQRRVDWRKQRYCDWA